MSEGKTVCWGFADDEQLQSELDDVVEYWLDRAWDKSMLTMTVEQRLAELPETIDVFGYKRMAPDADCLGECVIDRLLEQLDEEFADPDVDYSVPSKEMRSLASSFVRDVLKHYHVWMCEPSGEKVTIVVADWIQENAPEWLQQDGAEQ